MRESSLVLECRDEVWHCVPDPYRTENNRGERPMKTIVTVPIYPMLNIPTAKYYLAVGIYFGECILEIALFSFPCHYV